MQEYEFVLLFSLQNPDEDASSYEEALEKNGCTDALIGTGQHGFIALDFCREEKSAYAAIASAISAVEVSIQNAVLTRVDPDLVGITDIAEIVNRSRQNIRKLIYAKHSGAPSPVYSGSSTLWHLYDILKWLRDTKEYAISPELVDVAELSKGINAYKLWHQTDIDMRQNAKAIADMHSNRENIMTTALSV